MQRRERMKLTSGQNPITGKSRAIIDRASTQVNPDIPVFASPDAPQTLGESSGRVPRSIVISIRLGLGTQIQKIQVNPRNGLLFLEVLLDDLVNRVVGDGEKRGSEAGRGFLELRV